MDNKNLNSLKILVFTNDTASRKWRFDGIAERMHKVNGGHEMYITSWKAWDGDCVGADLVILEMLTSVDMVKKCQAQGAKVIFEADDALIDTYGRERKNLQHIGGNWKSQAIETIAACDAVTVTNWQLAENYKRFTKKPVYVLPNYMDFDWYGHDALRIDRNTNEIRIGWFGSRGHFEDLKMVLPALQTILDKYPQARLIYCGYGGMSSDKLSTEIGWGEDVFKSIPTTRREFVRGVNEHLWQMKHRTLDIDIGLAPLIDDEFNHCKTPIKWMEYGVLGVPAVVSPVVYAEHPIHKDRSTVTHGKNAFVAKTESDWVKYISILIEDATLRKKMGKAAKREVEKRWDLDKHWMDFEKVYQEVVSQK